MGRRSEDNLVYEIDPGVSRETFHAAVVVAADGLVLVKKAHDHTPTGKVFSHLNGELAACFPRAYDQYVPYAARGLCQLQRRTSPVPPRQHDQEIQGSTDRKCCEGDQVRPRPPDRSDNQCDTPKCNFS